MSNKLLIVIAAVFLLMMGMMGAGFFMLWSKMNMVQQPVATEEAVAEEVQENSIGPLFPLNTFIVNLADKDSKRYLRVKIEMELTNEEAEQEVEKRLPQVRDNILMIIPTRTFEDLNSAGGKIELRDELLSKLNALLMENYIKNIYFTEFVIQ